MICAWSLSGYMGWQPAVSHALVRALSQLTTCPTCACFHWPSEAHICTQHKRVVWGQEWSTASPARHAACFLLQKEGVERGMQTDSAALSG